jgi:hypothetical protein
MTRNDMRDALLRSGYLLEMRVARHLENGNGMPNQGSRSKFTVQS